MVTGNSVENNITCACIFILFQIFDGNHLPDKLYLMKHDLSEEVDARFVKIYIIDWESNSSAESGIVCTNVEFFGC